jgi:DNA-binding NarL/FixJ family response regulator
VAIDQPERAARLLGAAAWLEAGDVIPDPAGGGERARHAAAARARLGSGRFEVAWVAGRALSLDQARIEASALAEDPPAAGGRPGRQPPDPWRGRLTPRERDVAELLVRGLSNRRIAAELVLTEQTAETHVKRILRKLDLRSRHHVRAWLEGGTLPPLD